MRNRCSFFAWYRALPLIAVAIVGLISVIYVYAPSPLYKLQYPISHESQIVASARRHNVDPYLVCAVIKTESNWDSNASSHAGAYGLMQLLPETAQDMVAKGLVDGSEYDPVNLKDPSTNIEFGCAYLSYLLRFFNGSTDKAIAAYNAGMGNVASWTKNSAVLHNAITFPETQAYLVRVNNAYSRYKELYPTSFN